MTGPRASAHGGAGKEAGPAAMETMMDLFDNCQLGPDDPDIHYDDEPSGEPVGSCDECGTNLYPEDDEELCDQCLWRIEGGQ